MKEPTDLKPFLKPTSFIDFDHEAIQNVLHELHIFEQTIKDRAKTLFQFVRDQIQYELLAKMTQEAYIASQILEGGRGFCVQKATLLCALSRASEIPTALILSDLKDHSLSPKVTDILKTNIMYYHGLNAFYLDGRWIKVDASLSPDVVSRKRYRPVNFDGEHDALNEETTLDGKLHVAYIKFHGMYADVPFDEMIQAYANAYRHIDGAALLRLLNKGDALERNKNV